MPLVEIAFDNTLARVRTPSESVLDRLDRFVSYRVPGYYFMPKYRSGKWDGKIHLFHRRNNTFPAGLVARVAEKFGEDNEVRLYDTRKRPPPDERLAGATDSTKLRESQIEASDAGIQAVRGVYEAATGWGKCLTPETRVLTADLRWVPVGALSVGDSLVGFDESSARYRPRHFQRSFVLSTGRATLPCYEIELDTGERLVATEEHKWLVARDHSGNVKWRTTGQLYWSYCHKVRTGSIRLPRYLDVWDTDNSRQGGYLAGLFDGEGSIRRRQGSPGIFNGLSFSQKDPIVLAEALRVLADKRYQFKERKVYGGVHDLDTPTIEGIQFLGSIRPHRLLSQWLRLTWPRLTRQRDAQVVGIKPVGKREVVTLTTSTQTFLAEGFGSHNTSLMGSNITKLAVPALVLVHRRELAYQTLERFEATLRFPNAGAEKVFGIVGDDLFDPGLITVATYQTVYSMLKRDPKGTRKWLALFKALHVDEAHHVPARTLYAVCGAAKGAFWRLGYSATPFKSDKASELRLVSVTGEIIFSFGPQEAIEEGILVPPKIYMVDAGFAELDGQDILTGKYHFGWAKEYREGIVEHRERNAIIADFAEAAAAAKQPTLVLLQHLAQGRNILHYFEEGDGYAEFCHGSHPTSARKRALKRLGQGKLPILISSVIFEEGVDVPAIGCLILAGGYRAKHKALQRVGRGLRAAPGKHHAIVLDFMDRHSERLSRHSRERLAAYRKAGFEVNVVTPEELRRLIDRGGFWGSDALA